MKSNKKINFSILLIGAFLLSMFATSCYEEPFYECKIIVTDTNDVRIAGAQVLLVAPVSPPDTGGLGLTNINGEIDFEFPLEAVYEVYVDHSDPTHGSRSGRGFVKLEPSEKVKETIVIK